jgi:hypothetical protein
MSGFVFVDGGLKRALCRARESCQFGVKVVDRSGVSVDVGGGSIL